MPGREDPLAGAGRRAPRARPRRGRRVAQITHPTCSSRQSRADQAGAASPSIAGSRPIAASFFESDFAAYSKISDEW